MFLKIAEGKKAVIALVSGMVIGALTAIIRLFLWSTGSYN